MRRLKIAFQVAGIPGSRGVKALAASRSVSPPISVLDLVRALCEQGTLHKVDHFFVLVIENRSFDHLLGYSNISGVRPDSGENTTIDGLTQDFSNLDLQKGLYHVRNDAPFILNNDDDDIAHEFDDVKLQLCGNPQLLPTLPTPNSPEAIKQLKKAIEQLLDTPYSDATIKNSGFVLDRQLPTLITSPPTGWHVDDALRCFSPEKLPVLTTLAKEFVVCDRWFCSLPGPTYPNRMFLHAATSGGCTRSPGQPEIYADVLFGEDFQPTNGHIFDRLDQKALPWYLYAGDKFFNQSVLLDGIKPSDFDDVDDLAGDLRDPTYDGAYTFIEPHYDPLHHYADGNSMHPLNDVRRGERFVKEVYEAIRNSPLWERSVLIITFDEHGGFFDHVPPEAVAAPGDTGEDKPERHFDFTRLGPRVPTIIVSPLIPKNIVDNTTYNHASILKTLAMRFGLQPLTQRDAHATPFSHLFQLTTPRHDTPARLPEPVSASVRLQPGDAATARPFGGRRPDEVQLHELPPSIQTFIWASAIADLKLRGPEKRQEVRETFANLRTLADAQAYVEGVRAREHRRMMEEGGKRRRQRRSRLPR